MADSGTYDEATLARRYAMAQKLLMGDKQPMRNWAEGLSGLAESALGGYQWSKLENERKAEKEQSKADLYATLGLPAPAAAPTAPEGGFQKLAALLQGSPAAASASAPIAPGGDQASYPTPPSAPPAPTTFRPGITAPDPSLPRGLRNNNPLNIEAGNFTQGQPGFVGSDGRFARFETADQGIAAANKLLDTYESKYGLNTPAGIIGRWAPQGENNSSAYAATVAKKLGIGVNDPITPEMRPRLIAAMSEVENGRPAKVAQALTGDAALPPGATPVQGALPTAEQAASGSGILANVPQDKKLQIAKMLSSNNPTVKALGASMIQQLTKPETTDEIKEYNLAKSQGYKGTFVDFKTDLKKAGKPETTVNVGGGSDKQIFDAMDESAKEARLAASGLTGLREARNAIQAGAITGAGADKILAFQKIGAALGITDPSKIVNTETFKAAIAPQVAAVLKSTVGTTNISNTDREFAEKAAGGNITLDEKSITRLMDIMERASIGKLEAHQKKLEKIYSDPEKYSRERALFGVDMPAAPAITLPAAPAAPPPGVPAGALEEARRRGLIK